MICSDIGGFRMEETIWEPTTVTQGDNRSQFLDQAVGTERTGLTKRHSKEIIDGSMSDLT